MSTFSDIRATATSQQPSTQPQESVSNTNQLNDKEIVGLLDMIKRTTFLGEQVEVVYNMVLKLQNQYLEQTNKK